MMVGMMILVMNLIKIIYSEIDGRRANKQYNIRYFLQFTKPFAYGRASYITFVALIIFLISSDQKIFTMAWLIEFITLLCVAIIADAISQYAGYVYSKRRFKEEIAKAVELHDYINEEKNHENVEDIYYPEPFFEFKEVVQNYLSEEKHIGIASMDEGMFADSIQNLPAVTYVIDTKKEETEKRLIGKNVKVTSLTSKNGLPFKDEKLDDYICQYTNFDKKDVLRVLKPEGLLFVHQVGSEHLKELNTLILPNDPMNNWNKYACQSILEQNGFTILDGREQISKIGFRSISAFFTYIKQMKPERIYNFEIFLNQYAYINEVIKTKGFYEITIHEFYLVCKKK